METTPIDWNVAVAGSWNRAILTPAGIVRRVFNKDPSTPIEIMLAMDDPGNFKVSHEGITVEPRGSLLMLTPSVPDRGSLITAAGLAAHCVRGLPETPFLAAGINVRYAVKDVGTPSLTWFVQSQMDDVLSDQHLDITNFALKRIVKWREGNINIDVSTDTHGQGLVHFNFEKQSVSSEELAAWLELTEQVVDFASVLLSGFDGVLKQIH